MTTPSIGAIRWDAWYLSGSNAPSANTAVSLSDRRLQQYAPTQYEVNTTYKISPVLYTQAIFDAEITAAVNNGLSYWAFLMYGLTPGSPNYAQGLMDGWLLYQSSAIRSRMPWSAMMQLGLMGATGNFSTQVATMVGYFQQPNYFTVLAGRPLLYIFWSASNLNTYWGGSLSNVAAMISALRVATVNAGLPSPYVVVVYGAETTVYNGIGADAITAYRPIITPEIDRTYAQYSTAAQEYWVTLSATGVPIVPISSGGFIPTGRMMRPVPWEITTQRPYFGLRTVCGRPTADQLKAQIAAARLYVTNNPASCEANTILHYAWNECDEGQPICPTLGNSGGMALA